MMDAISGTRRAMKEMADGTIRVQVDIDASCRIQFLALFPNIDMPVAMAPLRADFEQTPEKPKGGELAKLAGMLCANPDFQKWCDASTPEAAATWVRSACDIDSRSELDHNAAAARKFHSLVRIPFMERAP